MVIELAVIMYHLMLSFCCSFSAFLVAQPLVIHVWVKINIIVVSL